MKLVSSVVLATLMSVSSLFALDYKVDKAHTNLGFKVKHMLVSNTNGTFSKLQGTFSYDPKTKTLSALSGSVEVKSINTQDTKRDDHLKGPDFFNMKKYPTMKMEFVRQSGEDVYVNLSIKDITKEIKLELDEASGLVKDPWGNQRSGFTLEGKINRNDFNIKFNKVLETGGLMVGEKIKLLLEIEGIVAKK